MLAELFNEERSGRLVFYQRCSKTLAFKVFCFEAYRAKKKLFGKEIMKLFKKYVVLDYIFEDIDIFINARKEYN